MLGRFEGCGYKTQALSFRLMMISAVNKRPMVAHDGQKQFRAGGRAERNWYFIIAVKTARPTCGWW